MAKGQKRSNREARKPKAAKPASAGGQAGTPVGSLAKGSTTPVGMPKQKKG